MNEYVARDLPSHLLNTATPSQVRHPFDPRASMEDGCLFVTERQGQGGEGEEEKEEKYGEDDRAYEDIIRGYIRQLVGGWTKPCCKSPKLRVIHQHCSRQYSLVRKSQMTLHSVLDIQSRTKKIQNTECSLLEWRTDSLGKQVDSQPE